MNRSLLVNGSFSGLWKSCSLIIKIIPATMSRSILFRVFSHVATISFGVHLSQGGGQARPGQGTLPWRGRLCELLAQISVPGKGPVRAGSQGSDFKFMSCQDIWWPLFAQPDGSPTSFHFILAIWLTGGWAVQVCHAHQMDGVAGPLALWILSPEFCSP